MRVPLRRGEAVFGDRRGGGTGREEDSALLAFAREAFGSGVPVLYGRQRHTTLSFCYSSDGDPPLGAVCVGTCDALITASPEVILAVRTADCLPVALAGCDAVAMVHAGWRGLAGDILGRVVRRLQVEFCEPSHGLQAVIGVGIGPCHYRVGEEVRAGLCAWDVGTEPWEHSGAVDLAAWARGRLQILGLPPDAITAIPGCTYCSGDHHSHRRDGVHAGRQWAGIRRNPDPGVTTSASAGSPGVGHKPRIPPAPCSTGR